MANRPQLPRQAKKSAEILPWAEEVDKHLRLLGYNNTSRRSSNSRQANYRDRYSFKVDQGSANNEVIVRCGRWTKYRDGTRYNLDLAKDGFGTSSNPDDIKTLTASTNGLNYVVLTVDDPDTPSTLTASLETTYPTEGDQTTLVLASFTYNSSETALSSKVLQLWRGGWYWDGWDDSGGGVTPGSIVPDDMDPDESPPSGTGWPDWIDEQLHDHEDHTFQSDDHTGTAGGVNELDRYIRHNADEDRNNFTDGSFLGKDEGSSIGSKSIDVYNQKLYVGLSGFEVESVDWLERELSSGKWTVTDTTPATPGDGALIVDGGMYAAKGIYADEGGAGAAAILNSPNYFAAIADQTNGRAGWFNDGTNTAILADATNAVTATGNIQITGTSGDYYHDMLSGSTILDWTSGGIFVGSQGEITIRVLVPGLPGGPKDIKILGEIVS